MKQLESINRSGWYWAALLLLALSLMGVALIFQYVRQEWPCLLCIHVRLVVSAWILVALAGWFVRRRLWANMVSHGLMTVVAGALLNRSLVLFGTERGTVFGECSMNLGLPSWFALDKWFPAIYEVQSSCGYTPELLFGITMAEALLALSWLLLTVTVLQLILSVVLGLKPQSGQ